MAKDHEQHTSEAPPVALSLIDGFVLSGPGGRVEMSSAKARAIFAHLSLSPNMEQTRERLAGLLWGDTTDRKARASLRGALLAVREALGPAADAVLAATNQSVKINPESLQVDILEIGNWLRSGVVPEVLLQHVDICDRIMSGMPIDDEVFAEWLTVYRQTTQENWMRSLREILQSHADPIVRADAATAIRNLDPLHEEACRYLMEHSASRGDTAAALKIYNQLYQRLGDEYDMEPAEETQALVEKIKLGGVPRVEPLSADDGKGTIPAVVNRAPLILPPGRGQQGPVGSAASGQKPIVTIMVGDFAADLVSTAQRYLVTGFKGDLITGLVRFRDWVIMSSTPAMGVPAYGPNDPFYILSAGAMEEPNGIRLSMFIQHGVTGQFVWTERFLLFLEEWAMRQRMIVRRLAMALNVHLSSERVRSLAAADEFSAGVQDQWLRGQELTFRWRPDALNDATQIFNRIIHEAPTFAPAYSSLVQITNSRHLIFPGVYRSAESSEQALALAKQAVGIDPLSSRAHLALAWSHMLRNEFDQAEFRYDLARDLNENDTWTLVSSGQGLAFAGRHSQAHGLSDEALQLTSHLSPVEWGYQVGTRFLTGDYDMAVHSADQAGDVIPNLPAWKAASLVYLGRQQEAQEEGQRFLSLMRKGWFGNANPDDSEIVSWLLSSFPIRKDEDRERFTHGVLSATGVSEAALALAG